MLLRKELEIYMYYKHFCWIFSSCFFRLSIHSSLLFPQLQTVTYEGCIRALYPSGFWLGLANGSPRQKVKGREKDEAKDIWFHGHLPAGCVGLLLLFSASQLLSSWLFSHNLYLLITDTCSRSFEPRDLIVLGYCIISYVFFNTLPPLYK